MTQTKPQSKIPKPDAGLKKRSWKTFVNGIRAKRGAPRFTGDAGHYALEIISDILTFALIWLGSLALLMSRGTIDLTPFKPRIEKSLSQAFGGDTADITHYRANWIQENQAIEIKADDITIIADNKRVQTIDQVRLEFSILPNIWSRPDLVSVAIDGGAITLERFADGRMQFGVGTPGQYRPIGPKLDQINGDQTMSGAKGWTQALGQFRRAHVQNVQLHIVDHLREGEWLFSDLSGGLSLQDEDLNFQLDGQSNQNNEQSRVFLAGTSNSDFSDISAELKLFNVNPKSIAPAKGQYGLLSRLDAPVDLNLSLNVGHTTGLRALAVDMNVGEGALLTGTTYKPFKFANISAQYKPEVEVIEVSDFTLESLALTAQGNAIIRNLGGTETGFLTQPIGFDLTLKESVLNAGQKFDTLFKPDHVAFSGSVDKKSETLTLDTVKVDFEDFQIDLAFSAQRVEGSLNTLSATGQVLGQMTPRQLLNMWPNDFAFGAREWIGKSIKTGTLSNLKMKIDLDHLDLSQGYLANDHLEVKFDFDNADVEYISTMPWLRGVDGYGVLQGNRADIYVAKGHVDGMRVQKGEVHIPRLLPKGGDIIIQLWGSGAVNEMLRVTNLPPFEFSRKFGVEPQDFIGSGNIVMKVIRPLLRDYDRSRIVYEVEGDFQNVGTPVGVGIFKLTADTLKLVANKDGLSLIGPVKIGNWPASLDWHKPFGTRGIPSYYTLKGKILREHLDAFGVGLRKHFGGEIDLTLSGSGDGIRLGSVNVEADFTKADVNIGTLWNKPTNQPGQVKAVLSVDDGVGYSAKNVQIKAPGMDIATTIELAEDFQLKSIDAKTVSIQDFVKAAVKGTPTQDGILALSISGQFLNVEPWIAQAFKTQSNTLNTPILLTASLKDLRLQKNYHLNDAAFVFSNDGTNVQHARLKGQVDDEAFLAEITLDPTSNQRRVRTVVPNAAKAAKSFLGLDSIREGALTIEGILPPAGEVGGLNAQVLLEDFVLVRAPAFTQILSIASLSGLADTLSGKGLRFEVLELTFSLKDGVLKIRDGRATGSALGLTGAGDVDLTAKTVDFNGVLVPSYSVNSVLGGVPVLGEILVGKKGEGIFAINYSVKGPFSQTQIAVNPLSALTPGILRRIFDVKRDDVSDPVLQDLIEAQKRKKEN